MRYTCPLFTIPINSIENYQPCIYRSYYSHPMYIGGFGCYFCITLVLMMAWYLTQMFTVCDICFLLIPTDLTYINGFQYLPCANDRLCIEDCTHLFILHTHTSSWACFCVSLKISFHHEAHDSKGAEEMS